MATNLYAFTNSQAAGSKILPPENITVINGDFSFSGNVQITGNLQVTGNITASGTIMGSNTSHIGMIIQSTKLDTMAKVIAEYGGTTWIQHSGYFLYGATSDVKNGTNGQSSDGGSQDAVVVSHTHSYSGTTGNNSASHYHGTGGTLTYFAMASGAIGDEEGGGISGTTYDYPRRPAAGSNNWGAKTSTGNQSANHNHSYSGTTGAASSAVAGTGKNMPPYKNVYIWERTA